MSFLRADLAMTRSLRARTFRGRASGPRPPAETHHPIPRRPLRDREKPYGQRKRPGLAFAPSYR